MPTLHHDDRQVFGCFRTAAYQHGLRHGLSPYLVTIPIFQKLILADRPEVMRVSLESDLHNTFIVREDRFVTVSKVQAPYLDVLVGRARNYKLGVVRDIHGKNRQLWHYGR